MIFNKNELEVLKLSLETYKKELVPRGLNSDIRAQGIANNITVANELISKINEYCSLFQDKDKDVDKFFNFMDIANFYRTEDYVFFMDQVERKIECTGHLIEDYLRVDGKEDFENQMEEEVKELQRFADDTDIYSDVKFCSICGAPMQQGYANKDKSICIDSFTELSWYMNARYGYGKWKVTAEGSVMYYDGNIHDGVRNEFLNKDNWKETGISRFEYEDFHCYC